MSASRRERDNFSDAVIGASTDSADFDIPVRVEHACNVLALVEISDEQFRNGGEWAGDLAVADVLARVVRPSVFILQWAVDPTFARGTTPYHLVGGTRTGLMRAIRKILELCRVIAMREPLYPSYIQIWDGLSARHLAPADEPDVSDRAKNMFEILDNLVTMYGFEGMYSEGSRELEDSLAHLIRVSRCWAALLGTRGEYPEYDRSSGRMMRRPIRCGW